MLTASVANQYSRLQWPISAHGPPLLCAGVRMAVAILACAGLMVVLAVLGAVRMRGMRAEQSAREVSIEDKQEMEWDNSALTITVNPMEQEVLAHLHDYSML